MRVTGLPAAIAPLQRAGRRWLVIGLCLGLFGAASDVRAQTDLPKVVSIDYCADQYVLALADRDQIAGVSPRATKAFSFHRDRAGGLPVVEATTEAVLDRSPDLVVRFWGGNTRMVGLLGRVGIDAVNGTYGIDDRTIAENLRTVGRALGRTAHADIAVSERDSRIAALQARPASELRALYLTPSGTTGGAGTDVGAMLRLAGLENLAVDYGYSGWRTVSIERLLQSPPDLFVGSFFDDTAVARSSWSVARHGRLAGLMSTVPTVGVPGRFLSCSGLFSVEAAEFIRAAVTDLKLAERGG